MAFGDFFDLRYFVFILIHSRSSTALTVGCLRVKLSLYMS